MHTEPLPCQRLLVFHPGKTDTLNRQAITTRQLHLHLGRGQAGFFDEQEFVLAGTIRLKTQLFFHLKIFGKLLKHSS